ncbi:polysaccharide pyruvyl transferase family protein [Clostridium akagii]|uniref:polysaccharide pyruvyl transferase family protein n=1 Tax=Clostridium akagii TaxID=91623 RepID=UPI00047B20F7|nr:polysaccharide pyruvyl transferase family protein [Clostridium akagii]
MKKNIGILYDNISGNTGDVAIGLSLRKIMKDLNVDFDELVPGNFNPELYDSIIIGGGHLIRKDHDFYYDKFKVRGHNILNSMGIVDSPTDLEYLNDYKYLSFRSSGDKKKAAYIKKESFVVPCTTMLLEDLNECPVKIEGASIGIHLIPKFFSEEEENLFINWISSLSYNVYFIPITHYNNDYEYMYSLSKRIRNASLLPIMTPMEIFTIIGKLKYIITCSLHGSIFSYIHNVPFILMDQDKSRCFLEDRGLERYLFNSLEDVIRLSEEMLGNKLDYSNLIIKDKNTLSTHVKNIEENIPKSNTSIASNKNISDQSLQTNHQINFLQAQIGDLHLKNQDLVEEVVSLNEGLQNKQNKINDLEKQVDNSKNEIYDLHNKSDNFENKISCLQDEIMNLRSELKSIYKSRGWKMLLILYKSKDSILRFLKRFYPKDSK